MTFVAILFAATFYVLGYVTARTWLHEQGYQEAPRWLNQRGVEFGQRRPSVARRLLLLTVCCLLFAVTWTMVVMAL